MSEFKEVIVDEKESDGEVETAKLNEHRTGSSTGNKESGDNPINPSIATATVERNVEENQTTDSMVKTELETIEIEQPSVVANAKFESFLQLRNAIEKYQRDNSVQLIVKDSKLLKSESTRKIIPKVHHLVNPELMYHSITYVCKCHGELKAKPGSRKKNIGQKRLNCPMYIRLKLSPDLKSLVLFDLYEVHNHDVDRNTFQLTPKQQVYQPKGSKRRKLSSDEPGDASESKQPTWSNISIHIQTPREGELTSSLDNEGTTTRCTSPSADNINGEQKEEEENEKRSHGETSDEQDLLDSSTSCSDSDEEELMIHRRLLPFPIRLIGSAISCNPELLSSTKELIELQKAKLVLKKNKLKMETKLLELKNTKLELEVKQLQKAATETT